MRFSCLTSKFVWVVLDPSMYYGMIPLGELRLTRSSMWWRNMKLPNVDQKSCITSLASGNESWSCGRDPSGSPRKSILLSPWIGRCRTKVDVLSSWSPSGILIRPSAIGKINSLFGEISPLSHWVFSIRFPMRPSFPTPQRLRSVRHPSKFHTRTERVRGRIQVTLSLQNDGFLNGPWQWGDTQPMNQME